jgi:glycine/D-amino acid oxidase-like deaminating enzyme
MVPMIPRRDFLAGAGAAAATAFAGCAAIRPRGDPAPIPQLVIPRLNIAADRITSITVCTRPFRAQGPRLESVRMGGKTVIHHYGHGGSGWSLSWGSGYQAMQHVIATGERDIAVVGCGAIGLTTAVLLVRAGMQVTIYAKDLPPFVRSSWATGVYSPDSRIVLAQHATPEFNRNWSEMARYSWRAYQGLLGLADQPVEYVDVYSADGGPGALGIDPRNKGKPEFAMLERKLLADMEPGLRQFPPGTHSLGAHHLERSTTLLFNISAYARVLMAEFRSAGGRIEVTEFNSPSDLVRLAQKTIVNSTGYGARALFSDDSVIPVRGQLAHTTTQEGIHYGLEYKDTYFVPRRDGFVFQVVGRDDYYGYGDDTVVPDRAEAEHAVNTIGSLFPSP